MPLRDIVVGRDQEDLEKFGKEGTIFLGKHIVGSGEEAHLTNPVRMDVSRPHVMMICGKRGQGKCLLPQENVQLFDGNLKNIERIYRENKDKGKYEINRKDEQLIKLDEAPEIISLDRNLKTKKSIISHLYRKKVEENLVKIKTRTGKEITVTREHPLLDSSLNWKKSANLKKGNFIAIPSKIDIKEKHQDLEAVGDRTSYSLWSQKKADILIKLLENGKSYAYQLKQELKFDPYKQLKKLSESGLIKLWFNSPVVCSLTRKGKEFTKNLEKGEFYRTRNSSKPIKIPENEKDMASFMAYLIAEGTEARMPHSFRYIFTNSNKEMKNDFSNLANRLFSLKTANKRAVYFDSLSLKDFLENNGYECGKKSRDKEIPGFILTSPALPKFLRTFFDCEASVSVRHPEIELSSASEKIINQISYSLIRFGVFSYVKEKVKSNRDNKVRRKYYILKVSGKKNLARFREKIGFGLEEKRKKLDRFLNKNSNTNIDTIPYIGSKIKRVRKLIEMNATDMGVKKQVIKPYEDEKYKPSKKFLGERLEEFEKRLTYLKKLYENIKNNRDPDLLIKAVEGTFLEWKKINKRLGSTYSGKEILSIQSKSFQEIEKIVLEHLEKILGNKELKKLLYEIKVLVESDIFWDEIVSVEETNYSGWVYDITVPETHNFIAGENGGIICHNSYTGAILAEEISRLPKEVKNDLSVLLVDTMGIFWSMKNPNERQMELLSDWNLKPDSFDVDVYIPEGFERDFKKKDLPYDHTFTIKPSELKVEDWSLSFNISLTEPIGILLNRVMKKLEGEDYSLDDIISQIREDEKADKKDKEALENRFLGAKDWGIFSQKGTKIEDILSAGKISILDVSFFGQLTEGWSVRSLLVGLLSRKIYRARIEARREEELSTIEGSMKRTIPLTWMIMDEAHTFLPNEGSTAASSPLLTLVKQGRQPGISTVFITQRPNKIHEDAISQSDLVLSHRLTAKPDLEALRNIMQTYLLFDIQKYIGNLPREKGTAIILDDNSERIYPMKVRPRMSWHAGETPIVLEKKESEF